MTSRIVKKFIDQQCIGYQRKATGIWSVVESEVEYTDGTRQTVWEVYPPIDSSIPVDGALLDHMPRIDIKQERIGA